MSSSKHLLLQAGLTHSPYRAVRWLVEQALMEYKGEEIGALVLAGAVNRVMKQYNTHVTIDTHLSQHEGLVQMASRGAYCYNTGETYILFNIGMPSKNMKMPIDRRIMASFSDIIFSTFIHEMRHKYQWSRREPGKLNRQWIEQRRYRKNGPERLATRYYLGDPDEIDAYAVSISYDLLTSGIAGKWLTSPSVCARLHTHLGLYFDIFEGNLQDPTLRKLAKKITQHVVSGLNYHDRVFRVHDDFHRYNAVTYQ